MIDMTKKNETENVLSVEGSPAYLQRHHWKRKWTLLQSNSQSCGNVWRMKVTTKVGTLGWKLVHLYSLRFEIKTTWRTQKNIYNYSEFEFYLMNNSFIQNCGQIHNPPFQAVYFSVLCVVLSITRLRVYSHVSGSVRLYISTAVLQAKCQH